MLIRIFLYAIFLLIRPSFLVEILPVTFGFISQFSLANRVGAFIFLFLMEFILLDEDWLESFVYVLFLFGSAYFVNEFTIPFTRIFGEAFTICFIVVIFSVLIIFVIDIVVFLQIAFDLFKFILIGILNALKSILITIFEVSKEILIRTLFCGFIYFYYKIYHKM